MTQKADNLRVKRTKILLREALIALIEERGFDALTVGELTQRAMVSRPRSIAIIEINMIWSSRSLRWP